jgi:hypothetical protein
VAEKLLWQLLYDEYTPNYTTSWKAFHIRYNSIAEAGERDPPQQPEWAIRRKSLHHLKHYHKVVVRDALTTMVPSAVPVSAVRVQPQDYPHLIAYLQRLMGSGTAAAAVAELAAANGEQSALQNPTVVVGAGQQAPWPIGMPTSGHVGVGNSIVPPNPQAGAAGAPVILQQAPFNVGIPGSHALAWVAYPIAQPTVPGTPSVDAPQAVEQPTADAAALRRAARKRIFEERRGIAASSRPGPFNYKRCLRGGAGTPKRCSSCHQPTAGCMVGTHVPASQWQHEPPLLRCTSHCAVCGVPMAEHQQPCRRL